MYVCGAERLSTFGAANVLSRVCFTADPTECTMCHIVFLDRPISKVVPLVKDVKISEICDAASTHALCDRQQSNRSRTTDFNLDQHAQGCKETTTVMCKNGVWQKQNNQCCAVPSTNYTAIPTMGRREFAVAISGDVQRNHLFHTRASRFLYPAINTENYATTVASKN